MLQFDILCFGCAITSRKKFKSTQRLQKMQAGKLMHVILCPTVWNKRKKIWASSFFSGFFNPNCFRSKTLFLCHVLRVRRKVSLASKVNYFYQELKTLSSLSKLFCNFLLFYCFRIFRKMKRKMLKRKLNFLLLVFIKLMHYKTFKGGKNIFSRRFHKILNRSKLWKFE